MFPFKIQTQYFYFTVYWLITWRKLPLFILADGEEAGGEVSAEYTHSADQKNHKMMQLQIPREP